MLDENIFGVIDKYECEFNAIVPILDLSLWIMQIYVKKTHAHDS